MKHPTKASKDRMGLFNNAVVELIDKTDLTPVEVLLVLRLISSKIKHSFELSISGKGV